jgi:hypothetical protein
LTTIMIGKALATVTENEILTSGMINAKIKFVFSADWYPALSKTAIFTAGDVTKVVLDSYWENNVCSIPQECLEKSDEILMVGIYGVDNANVVAIPTVWATVGKIRKGYEGYEDVSTGTLPIWAQVQSAAAQSATAAKNAQTAAETAQGKAEDAQEAAEAAQAKAETAQSKAETAQSKAETAQGKTESAQSAAESAASSSASAANAAISAATAAAASETSAAEYEAGAKTAAASAAAKGKLAESWAVGGTGTREGENTNNAKYWAMAAQGAAGGGVTSFNGRSGAVAPQKGDYTADMVGADAQGAAATVQGNLSTHAQNTTIHITAAERTAWDAKQNALTFDTTPTKDSTNPVTSGGVKAFCVPVGETGYQDQEGGEATTLTVENSGLNREPKVGQMMVEASTGTIYFCISVNTSAGTSQWYCIENAVGTKLDTKQDKSTAITTSNIGSQTVNYAKYAPNTIVATRAALRNEYFTSAEDTPTTNGIIAWVIG